MFFGGKFGVSRTFRREEVANSARWVVRGLPISEVRSAVGVRAVTSGPRRENSAMLGAALLMEVPVSDLCVRWGRNSPEVGLNLRGS